MNDKRKAHPSGATLRQATESGTACKTAHTSTTNDTIPAAVRQQFRIGDFIEFGAENARTLRYLKSILHQDGRTIRAEIESARKNGIPIVSDCKHGYWLTDDPAEIIRFSRSMRHRAAQIRLTAMYTEKAVKNWNKTP